MIGLVTYTSVSFVKVSIKIKSKVKFLIQSLSLILFIFLNTFFKLKVCTELVEIMVLFFVISSFVLVLYEKRRVHLNECYFQCNC